MASGLLFSIVSIGSLCTLSLLFLNRYSPASRNIWGSLGLAVTFFGMAVGWPLPLEMFLLMIGMCQGVIYPALGTYLTSVSGRGQYGKVFALLSISFSIGAFLGPVLSGQLRDHISPYYAAFLTLMLALALFPTGNRVAPFPLIKRQEER